MAMFPTDDACLAHLFKLRYGPEFACPRCGMVGKWHKLSKMPAYSCQGCGDHIHPMSGTFFYRSHTPLQKWFYAMYLFTTSRHGVPAKELQRQLGVTYKTAWRMAHLIRMYMAKVDGDGTLSGHVEADETYVGGKVLGRGHAAKMTNKTIVFGAVERGGEVITRVIPDTTSETIEPLVHELVAPQSTVSTDDARVYRALAGDYRHDAVNHSE